MRIGDTIKEIRELEKNYKASYVADKIGISTRAYINIENNTADITLTRLEKIADIFGCDILYILNYRQNKQAFFNNIHNNNGNKGVILIDQSNINSPPKTVEKLLYMLLESERNRINLLEKLLKKNNIDF